MHHNGVLKRVAVYGACVALVFAGCAPNPRMRRAGSIVGPPTSSAVERAAALERAASVRTKPRLDVVVPVFDPGLSKKAEMYAEPGVWPELRRAEANRFAHKLKLALEETGAFGAIRVTPDATATGDLYVLGAIEESNGETVAIDLEVRDSSNARWFGRSFEHAVVQGFYKNIRNKGTDAYDPVFARAAAYVVEQLDRQPDADLERLKLLTDLRFGASLTAEAFTNHLGREADHYVLTSYPSADDPMLRRTKDVRVRDQLFIDDLQDHYRAFSDKMDESYRVWQEHSLIEVEAQRKAKRRALLQGLAGAALVGLGIAALSTMPSSTAATTAGLAGGVVGAIMIGKGFQTSKEAKVHRDALNELGESIDVELAPQVVEFHEQTEKLTGDAKEQFSQWRAFLKKIYEQERTPEVDL